MVRRWGALLGLLSLLFATVLVGSPSGAGADSPPVFTSADGLTVLSANPVGDREWQLTVGTAALSQPVRVTILLPAGYSSSTARYPVLYLYHGTSGGANDWIDSGNATAATAPYPLIVVMPDAGYNGN